MKRLVSAAVLAISITAAGSSAIAANADIAVTATPVPLQVSVSRECTATGCKLVNYAAWEITVQNRTTNVINQVVLSGSTDVTGATPDQTSTFVESIPFGVCTSPVVPADKTITCNVGQVRQSSTFVVIFRSPPISNGISDITYDESSAVVFNYSGTFSNASSPTAPAADGTGVFYGSAATTLITTQAALIRRNLKTYVPSVGGKFFTGSNATAFDFDPSTTTLGIPGGLRLTTAEILESDGDIGGLTNVTLTTNTTFVRVPPPRNAQGTAQLFSTPITIELRRDSSTIRTFNQIDRAVFYYQSEDGEPVTVLPGTVLQNCADVAGPNATYPVCIGSRIAVTKRIVTQGIIPPGLTAPLTADDEGDWIFILKALQNGRLSW